MAQVPYELIRQVQIRTRAAAGLPDYDPSNPTLPALPPLSATIAAAAGDASPPDRRCRNCKALLLRGSESIVCLYCGIGPHYGAVPDPICFTSTVGYQWLLRSLRLDGSEMVDPTSKSNNQGKGQSSPKDLTPLSVYLNFKIAWPAENANEEISSDKHLEERKRSLILTGVAPDRFFLNSKSNGASDTPIEQPSDHKWAEADTTKDVAALGNQDFFENVESSKPAVSSSEHTTSKALTGWEADFQFADSENQLGDHESSEHVIAASEGSEIKFEDPGSFQSSSSLNVDLGAHLDSVFGPGENLSDGKPNVSSSIPAAGGDWNSDDVWNNLGSSTPDLSGGFDATFSTKGEPQNDQTLDHSNDLSTNKATNEEHTATDEDVFEDWNDFASSTNLQAPPQVSTSEDNPLEGDLFSFDYKLEGDKKSSDSDLFSFDNKFEDDKKPSEGDLFSFDNKLEGDKKPSDTDLFSFDNKVEDDKKSSERDLFSFDNKFEGDAKSSERDLFSFDSNFGGDFSGNSQPNLFSTSTSNSNAPAEGNAMMSEDPASIWFSDASSPSLEPGQAANNENAFGQSSKDDVKTLISQMHDLSFMLETDLSVPSSSDDHKPAQKD